MQHQHSSSQGRRGALAARRAVVRLHKTCLSRWLQGQSQLKPQTRERYRNIVRVQILPEWDRVGLSAIGHADVVAWVAKLVADGYAASTVRQVHRVFSLMLDLAVRDGRLPRNPATGVRLPRAAKGEPVFLTHAQVEKLALACPGYELFCTGARLRRDAVG